MNLTTTKNYLKWYSQEIAKDSSHLRQLTAKEKSVIENALRHFANDDLSWKSHIKHSSLEALRPLYDEIMDALIYQKGFILLKGFPASDSEHGPEKVKKLLLEFCLYLGMPLKQNRNEDVIFDVKSIEGMTFGATNFRGPYVKEALPMHTDAGAILGMYCYSAANVGGMTLLSSARTVHDEIQKIRPDLLATLYQPFYIDRRGHEPKGALPYDLSPVFAMYGDELTCQYHQPFCSDAYEKYPHLPKLTAKQLEAFELFDTISKRKDIAFEIKVEPGNLIFINNEKLLHGRTTFDYPENQTVRHLLRIWLNTPEIQHTFPNYLGYDLPEENR